jgi:serine/threonine-protein kinase
MMSSSLPSAHAADPSHADAPTLLAPDTALATAQTAVDTSSLTASLPPPSVSAARTTVLPRIEGDGVALRLIPEARTRYEPIKLLGAGGMGEVLLVKDQDIARPVAIKRLLPEMNDPALLARFVDEIRTVGRLEHPNIVPIHDVGVDELGRYFFVMKYVEGETLESIIRRLDAGDPAYHRKYTFERRVEIFMAVLQALAYAHASGVVHRDIKPANVMVGRYGEVLLMDWGIAKPIDEKRDLATTASALIGVEEAQGERGRMFATRVGALVGTPAYMAPEQARSENDRIDARSDLYSAAVLFHELITLRHYLADKQTTEDLLAAVIVHEPSHGELIAAAYSHPHQRPPAELVHFVQRGMAKDPARRYQSANEMIDMLQRILEGRLDVQCAVTMQKRMLREAVRMVDRAPWISFAVLFGIVGALVFTVVMLVRMAIS